MAQSRDIEQGPRATVPAVQSLERAARILLTFTGDRPAWSLADLVREVGLSKSTVRRLLLTLEDLGFVATDGEHGLYRLGVACLQLGQAAQSSFELRPRARPVLEALAAATGETAYLFVRNGGEAVCIDIVEASREIRVLYTGLGTAFPLYAGGAPRALLSTVSRADLAAMLAKPLKRYTPATLADRTEILEDIQRTRRLGYAASIDDLVIGVAGVGCVIWDHRGEAAGAVSISGLKDRFIGPELGHFTSAVASAAAEISSRLGFRAHAGPSAQEKL